ncbi:MAG: hypothetical protein Q6363_005325 [Candidatus Njordarchaeota archaeon]
MARKWVVLFEGDKPGPADDFELEFTDIIEVLGEIPIYKKLLFDKLIDSIKQNENYYVWENIKDIKPPEEVPFGLDNYFIVLAVDKEELRFGILMVLYQEKVIVGGLWPSELAEAVKEDHDILDAVLYTVLEKPENWKELVVVYAPSGE